MKKEISCQRCDHATRHGSLSIGLHRRMRLHFAALFQHYVVGDNTLRRMLPTGDSP